MVYTSLLSPAHSMLALLKMKGLDMQEEFIHTIIRQIPTFWPEYYEAISELEKRYNETAGNPLIAYAISQIYFYSGDADSALQWIFRAKQIFDIRKNSPFHRAILSVAVKRCMAAKEGQIGDPNELCEINKLIEAVLNCSLENENPIDRIILMGLSIDIMPTSFLSVVLEHMSTSQLTAAFFSTIDTARGGFKYHSLLDAFNRELSKRGWEAALARNRCLAELSLVDEHAEFLCGMWLEEEQALALQAAADIHALCNVSYCRALEEVIRQLLEAEKDNALCQIIGGKFAKVTESFFLREKAVPDIDILKGISTFWKPRDSISSNAHAFAISTLMKGTKQIDMLKSYTQQFEKVKNWACFSMIGGLGCLSSEENHTMYIRELKFQENNSYSQGGNLFGKGLARYCQLCSEDTKSEILEIAKGSDQIVAHGALLNLGLQFAFSNDAEITETCKLGLYSEKAILGEAAGIALGFIKIGVWEKDLANSLINFCRDNDQIKVTRSIALYFGMSALNCAQPEAVTTFFNELIVDNDFIIRMCAINALAMAYVCTSQEYVVEKLLNTIATDASNDVRRAAVIGLGMVMLNQRNRALALLTMLSTNYNSYVRHGVGLAIGFVFTQTFDKRAIKVVKRLFDDKVDYVRQAGAVALGLICCLGNEQFDQQFNTSRKMLSERLNRKQESNISKLGCVMGLSLSSAGGGNCALSLITNEKLPKIKNIAAAFSFTHFWYWFPAMQLLTLALEPVFAIGVTVNLRVPTDFHLVCRAHRRFFDYIRPTDPSKDSKKPAAVVQLSTTRRANLRHNRKDTQSAALDPLMQKMIIEEPPEQADSHDLNVPDDKRYELENPSRVTKKQSAFIDILIDETQRYVPITKTFQNGITILLNRKPAETQEAQEASFDFYQSSQTK